MENFTGVSNNESPVWYELGAFVSLSTKQMSKIIIKKSKFCPRRGYWNLLGRLKINVSFVASLILKVQEKSFFLIQIHSFIREEYHVMFLLFNLE